MMQAQRMPARRMSTRRWHGFADAQSLHHRAAEWILDAAAHAIDERGCFHLVLAGGDTPRSTYRRLRAASADVQWARWQVWFGDERCLPADDPQRNSCMAREQWLDHVPLPAVNVHVMAAELGAHEAARRYVQALDGVGCFDLVLLGLGEDGHTASLFPGHDLGNSAQSPDALAVFDAPKPPAQRVSLSAARLSRSRAVLFLVSGASKQTIARAWRDGASIPADAIAPTGGVDVLIEPPLPST